MKSSRYSESTTAKLLPGQCTRREAWGKSTRSPLSVDSVFLCTSGDRTKPTSINLGSGPRWKEGGVFNRLGRKEPGASIRSDSHHQSSQAKGTEVLARKHHHEGNIVPEEQADILRDNDAYIVGIWTESEDTGKNHISYFKSAAQRLREGMPTIQWEIHHIKQKWTEAPSTERTSWKDTKKKSWRGKERPDAMKDHPDFMHGITHLGEVAAFVNGPEESTHAMEATRRGKQTELQKGFQKQAQVGPEARQVFTPYKDPEGNFCFRKRKVQGTSTKIGNPCGKGDQKVLWNSMPDKGHKGSQHKRITQSFSPETTISFPPLGDEDGTEGPMIIKAEIGGHFDAPDILDGGGEQGRRLVLSLLSSELPQDVQKLNERAIVSQRKITQRYFIVDVSRNDPQGTFEATNNEAEYEALIAGLRIAEQMGVKNLQANVDSRLVANQFVNEVDVNVIEYYFSDVYNNEILETD
ncbi:reverse transcriptase domain-containing protein [Tanacetum coccineum]